MVFKVESLTTLETLYNWRLNGRPLRTHTPRYAYRSRRTAADTLEVEVRTRGRGHRRRWVIRPPFEPCAWPNPFNPETWISFSLARPSHLNLDIHALTGQRLRRLAEDHLNAGRHRYRWNGLDDEGRPAASGLYFFRLTRDDGSKPFTGKLLLLR